jgi:hypothetical protein
MIEELYCTIADKLKLTGYFNTVYEYTELVQRSDGTLRPMYYRDGYVDVQNFDKNGVAYLRKSGQVTMQVDTTAPKLAACNDMNKMVAITIPMRLVAAVPKMNDDVLALDLIATLQGDLMQNASIQVRSFDTDSYSVWADENKGIKFDENKLFRFSYVAIDYICQLKANIDCFKNCENDVYVA